MHGNAIVFAAGVVGSFVEQAVSFGLLLLTGEILEARC